MANLFTSQTPANGNNFDASPLTLATTVTFSASGQVTGGRFYASTSLSGGSYELVFWQETSPGAGTILAQATYGAISAGTWNSIVFSSPVSVSTGVAYVIGIRTSVGRYTTTPNFFTSALTNGNITGIQDNTDPVGIGTLRNGTFAADITSFPASTFTATGSMSASLTAEPTLRASFSASGSMTAALTTETSGPTDPIASPVANQLLACLTEQMNALTTPPAKIELRAGAWAGPLIGENVDECCPGLAWVRVANVYPSWNNFPSEDNDWLPCGPLAYAVVLEMGSAFCMPWSDSEQAFDNMDPPSTNDWLTGHTTLMQHQTLLRRAAACCFGPTQRRVVGGWEPLSVEGGCMGGTLRVTVSVMAPCSDC